MAWYWYAVICCIVGAPLTLVLHELMHCIVVWANGGWVTSFKPWPHFVEKRFYWGRMAYAGCAPTKWFYAAPLTKALVLLVIWAGLGFLWMPLWAPGFWELLDAGNWLQGYIRNSDNDGGRYRKL